ncbi:MULTISPECIES: hypothetical protein [unclassified Streptomyces]|uniref:hypothetical protein n=1 Tax=unclassified Streptomyces TaxID=2593676 RepID=UPI0035D73511
MSQKLWRVVLAGATVSVLAACSGNPDAPSTPEGEPAVEIVARDSSVGLVFPLDSYRMTESETRAVDQATKILAAQCMKRFGFVSEFPRLRYPSDADSHARLYGVTDGAEAQQYGYRHPPEAEFEATPVQSEVSAQENAVLLGRTPEYRGRKVPEGGCMGESSAKVRTVPNRVKNIRLADDLIMESSSRAQSDSRVLEAFSRWSACLAAKGYSYKKPTDVMQDDKLMIDPTASTREKALAVADVNCKKKANVVGVWSSVEMAYQSEAVERHAEEMQQIKENLKSQVVNANRLLTGT